MGRRGCIAALLVVWLIPAVAAAAEQPGLTSDTIRVGVFAPFTGAASLYGKISHGVEMVYLAANDAGGIHGRKFALVREDTACDPVKGIAAVKKLIHQDKVFMLHGGNCSNVVLAIKDEISKAGIPYMVQAAASYAISTPMVRNIFHPINTTVTVGTTMVDFAMSKPGVKRIAVVTHTDEWGRTNHDPTVQHLEKQYGLKPVEDVAMEKGTSDATPQLLRIRDAKPDFIIAILYPADLPVFLRAAYQYGLRVPVVTTQAISIEDQATRVGIPEAVDNLYVFYPFKYTITSPEMERWNAMLKRYFPADTPETISFLGTGGALGVVEAIRRAGRELTQQSLIRHLESLSGFETGILADTLGFTSTDHQGVKRGSIVTLVKGKTVVVGSKWREVK